MYVEHRHKINYTFHDDERLLRYNQSRSYEFVEHLSQPLDSLICHLNVPLVVSSHV